MFHQEVVLSPEGDALVRKVTLRNVGLPPLHPEDTVLKIKRREALGVHDSRQSVCLT